MVAYYSKLIGTPRPSRESIDPSILPQGPVLNAEEQTMLCQPVSDEEVKKAMWSINPDKAPGADGFGSLFFKHSWHIVGREICDAVRDFFRNGHMLKQINVTALVVIPKVANPHGLGDYRPIACCTVLYKLITKILTDRFNSVINKIVSSNQSAFIPGRSIADNILLAHELIRNYHRASSGANCAMKIDLRKAYDSIDWDYIEEVLMGFAFPSEFIHWVMTCIRNSSYSLVINGSLEGFFAGGRGLRQGDPMSPLLFVLCMEYLSRFLTKLDASFKYHKGCKSLRLNHLSFTDDLFFFCHGDLCSVQAMLKGLHHFASVSGLQVNTNKSNIFLSAGVSTRDKNQILAATGFAEGTFPIRYLGVPLISSNLSKQDCTALVDKITARIDSWGAKHPSYAGRLQLIVSVLRSMHIFWASIFVLPAAVVKQKDKKCRSFLWKGTNDRRGAPVAWSKVCCPKKEGGLGIKELKSWNNAAMGKLIWNLITNKENLWVKWIHTNKLKGVTFWGINTPTDASWCWRKLVQLREVYKDKFSYLLGDGTRFSFWFDPWLRASSVKSSFPNILLIDADISKKALVMDVSRQGSWLLPDPSSEEIELAWQAVTQYPLLNRCDKIVWPFHPSGHFTIATAWDILRPKRLLVPWFKLVWSKPHIPRCSFLLWLMLQGQVGTRNRLYRFGIINSERCELCGYHSENISHLFFHCPTTKAVWLNIAQRCMPATVNMEWRRIISWMGRRARGKSALACIRRVAFAATIYHVWIARNKFYFQQETFKKDVVIGSVCFYVRFCLSGNKAIPAALLTAWN